MKDPVVMEAQTKGAQLLWHIVQESHQFHPPQTNSQLADGWELDQEFFRYVDTFNKGGGNQTMFRSPSVPSVKAKSNASPNFFVPAPLSGQTLDSAADGNQPTASGRNISSISDSVQSFAPSSSMNTQRFASMDDISNKRTATPDIGNGFLPPHTRRTASWSGSIAESFSPPSDTEVKPLGRY